MPVFARTPQPAPCRQLVFVGEVQQGNAWQASIGHAPSPAEKTDWLIRLVPTRPSPLGASTGWDIAVSPATDQDYPDALLLASPPYGSLNAREIATTYGLRAQDAIAWSPRHFHLFFTSQGLQQARQLYRALLNPTPGAHPAADHQQKASSQLLDLAADPAHTAAGRLDILDAHLVSGSADPAPFAAQWAASLARTPHTLDALAGAKPAPLGEIHSLRFRLTLWLPPTWKAPSGVENRPATCAE